MQTSALLGAKKFGFLKFIVCPHGQGRGVESVRTRNRVQFFMRTSFMDGPWA